MFACLSMSVLSKNDDNQGTDRRVMKVLTPFFCGLQLRNPKRLIFPHTFRTFDYIDFALKFRKFLLATNMETTVTSIYT